MVENSVVICHAMTWSYFLPLCFFTSLDGGQNDGNSPVVISRVPSPVDIAIEQNRNPLNAPPLPPLLQEYRIGIWRWGCFYDRIVIDEKSVTSSLNHLTILISVILTIFIPPLIFEWVLSSKTIFILQIVGWVLEAIYFAFGRYSFVARDARYIRLGLPFSNWCMGYCCDWDTNSVPEPKCCHPFAFFNVNGEREKLDTYFDELTFALDQTSQDSQNNNSE